MTNLVRIPLAWPIGSRTGASQLQDPYIKNGVLEKYGDKLFVRKRPGTIPFDTIGPGTQAQGAFYFNGFYYAVEGDVLYRSSGVHSAGANGTTWSVSSTPTWPATELQNAIVFQDRIFMIGGFSSSAGIWSTQDGITWAVNAGGQPWGFRDQQGLVVFNNQMFILGGFNITLATCFNDVWSSSDGTAWTNISVDGAPGVWSTRCAHCAVAANNGIYIYGGLDTFSSTYYNDVWYSSDGIAWTQLASAAPWTARSSALSYWFDNKLWIVGGIDSGGNALNDAWSSPDGITWTQTTAAAFPSGRFDMYGCVYAGNMWAMGGTGSSPVFSNVYNSTNGITWTQVTATPGWTGRTKGQCVVFKNPRSVTPYRYPTMWILGGDNGVTTLREVWRADLNSPLLTSYILAPDVADQPYQFATYMNGTRLLLKNQSNFWVLEAGTLNKVIDPNYPPYTVPGIVVLNAFAYVMTPEGEIHSCKLDAPLTWPSLQFLTADYEDDEGIALVKYLNYVVALGQYTTQFFYDNGANQPVGTALAPYINANLRTGCTVASSVATPGNAVFFVGQGDTAARQVMMFNGLNAVPVSTPYIDRFLMQQATSQIKAFGAACDGHEYFVLKSAFDKAFVYDITMKEWYEWDTFRYDYYLTDFFTGDNYLLSGTGGNLMQFSPTAYTDGELGVFTLSCQTDKIDHGNTALKFCGRGVLVGDKSSAQPSIMYSDDDYQTYVTAGTVNMNSARPYITRLGSFRRRAWRPTQTDAYPARWECLEVEYSQGES